MRRRDFLLTAGLVSTSLLTHAQSSRQARLVIVGGAEDRLQDKLILNHFTRYAGGPSARIRLIASASSDPQGVADVYQRAFAALGVADFDVLDLAQRDSAFSPAIRQDILRADGIFMTGGDQSRLMATVWETPILGALHQAYFNGCCIAGTSAGAAVMSRHMIAQGPAVLRPRKDVVDTDIGLGLLSSAIVDQHFSERRRLARLLSALAQRPDLLGVGIDENTALVVERGRAIEVIGQGSVTLVDPGDMVSNIDELDERANIEMLGVQLHNLPAGHRYVSGLARPPSHWPLRLLSAVARLVAPGPVRS